MTPQDKGRHCAKCAHVVADLTTATDAELVALFTSDARPKCARFDPRQLDRLLSPRPERSSALPIAAFGSLLAVAAGQEALAQTPPLPIAGEVAIAPPAPPPPAVMGRMRLPVITAPPCAVKGEAMTQGQAIAARPIVPITGDTIMVVTPDPVVPRPGPFTVTGRSLDANTGETLPFAVVSLAEDPATSATSDMDGYFALVLPDSLRGKEIDLLVHYVGYTPRTIHLDPGAGVQGTALDRQPYRILQRISGRVIDAKTHGSVADATVVLTGTTTAGATNEHGLFGFDPPEDRTTPGSCVLQVTTPGYRAQRVTLTGAQWPLATTVALEPAEPSSGHDGPSVLPLGDVELTHSPVELMGEMVIVKEPSMWHKLTRPIRKIFR